MKEIFFKAELLDEIVLSQRTATAGDHKSLDYIPGTTILGAMAEKFYTDFGNDKSWIFFNSSKVCFCNAYPLINNTRSVPMPLSFHSEKVPVAEKENEVLNYVLTKHEETVQPKQVRSGYVRISDESRLDVYSVNKTSRRRTTVDEKTGSAAKSQLYGYESIDAGQIFVGKILWDNTVEGSDELKQILDIFEKGEVLHIGRSKTASYGRVKVSIINVDTGEQKKPTGKNFSILAVSDLCLRNPKTGRAELQLLPELIGLSNNWKIDSEHTFTRSNTIYQYNGFRRELEIQKTLISKGSVFTFKSERDLTPEEVEFISEKLVCGVGTCKGQGYGEITLFDIGDKFEKTPFVRKENKTDILTDKDKEWLEWLKLYRDFDDVGPVVEDAVKDFKKLCIRIASKNHFKDGKQFLPEPTQWSRIRNVVTNYTNKDKILRDLFDTDTAVIKAIGEKGQDHYPQWNYEDSRGTSLREWLKTLISSEKVEDINIQNMLIELCKRCSDLVKNPNWIKELR